MKVGIVNSFFPPWRGGAETYTYNLAQALLGRGHEITVVCASDPLPPGENRQGSLTIKRLPMLTKLYGTPITPTLPDELRKLDVDLFHANFPSPYGASITAAVSIFRRIPAVLTWHNDLPTVTSGARFLIEAHNRLVLPFYIRPYRKIISTTSTYAHNSPVLNRLGELVTVIPNGVDCKRFHPQAQASEVRTQLRLKDRFTILFVGALTKWHRYKGLDILLEAVKIVAGAHPDLMLVIVGDGNLKDMYISLSKQLDLKDNTKFVGDVPDEDIPKYYVAADVLVLPSKDMSEGFGLTLLEANASGKPAIASNVGGIPSVIKDGYNGMLVSPNDPRSLADAIMRLREKPDECREMGGNGRRFAELHDWSIIALKTERVYEDAISRV